VRELKIGFGSRLSDTLLLELTPLGIPGEEFPFELEKSTLLWTLKTQTAVGQSSRRLWLDALSQAFKGDRILTGVRLPGILFTLIHCSIYIFTTTTDLFTALLYYYYRSTYFCISPTTTDLFTALLYYYYRSVSSNISANSTLSFDTWCQWGVLLEDSATIELNGDRYKLILTSTAIGDVTRRTSV